MSLAQFLETDRRWMKSAIRQAEVAAESGEVPVGAVVVRENQVVGRGHNLVEALRDPTAHAEMIAITAACETLRSKHLSDCTLYVTLEPCPMCAGAIVSARLRRLCFGALDEKAGSASTLYNIPQDVRLNHHVDVVAGVCAEQSAEMLQGFFRARRSAQRAAHPG